MSKFTKSAIMAALVELLNENPLDKITVKDIVDRAGVNRNTFYYYYHDIYDLLEDLFITETRAVVADGKLFTSWKDGFFESIKFALDNKVAVYHLYNSLKREQLENFLYNVIENLMIGYIEVQTKDMDVKNEDKLFLAQFYKYALVGVILDWIGRGMKDDPNYFIDNLDRLLSGNIRTILENQSYGSHQIQ